MVSLQRGEGDTTEGERNIEVKSVVHIKRQDALHLQFIKCWKIFFAITFDKTQTSSLTLNDKLHSSLAFLMMLDVTVVAREIRRRVASYPEFCSAGCTLHDTISITMYSIVSCSVQYHAVYSTVQYSTVSCSVQCAGAGC